MTHQAPTPKHEAFPPVVALWDIDGTLVEEYRGEGTGIQLRAAREVLGVELEAPKAAAGATERMVWTRMFAAAGLPEPDVLEPLQETIDRIYVEHFAHTPRIALAGAVGAVNAFTRAGIVNSVLTGNGRPVARLKLESAGFDTDAFDWDAAFFGRDWADRIEMAKAARVKHPRAVIIGDTINDARCAAESGIPWIGVGTGGHTRDEFAAYPPVAWFDDLAGAAEELLTAVLAAA